MNLFQGLNFLELNSLLTGAVLWAEKSDLASHHKINSNMTVFIPSEDKWTLVGLLVKFCAPLVTVIKDI